MIFNACECLTGIGGGILNFVVDFGGGTLSSWSGGVILVDLINPGFVLCE